MDDQANEVEEFVDEIDEDDLDILSDSDGDPGNDMDVGFIPPSDDSFCTFTDHKESVFVIKLDEKGRFLATGGMDHKTNLYDLSTRELIHTFDGHDDSITQLAFTWDGQFLAIGDMSGKINIWSYSEGNWGIFDSFVGGDDLTYMDWFKPSNNSSCRTRALICGDVAGLITVYPLTFKNENFKLSKTTKANSKFILGTNSPVVFACSLNESMKHLAVLYESGILKVVDLISEQFVAEFELFSTNEYMESENSVSQEEIANKSMCLGISPEHYSKWNVFNLAAVGNNNGEILLVPLSNVLKSECDQKVVKINYNSLAKFAAKDRSSIERVSFCETHPYLAYITITGYIGIIDINASQLRQEWVYHDKINHFDSVGLTCLRWSKNFTVLFTSSVHGAIVAWPGLHISNDQKVPEPLQIFWGHKDAVMDIDLAQCDSRSMESYIVSCSDDCTTKIFNINVDEYIRTLNHVNQTHLFQ